MAMVAEDTKRKEINSEIRKKKIVDVGHGRKEAEKRREEQQDYRNET